MSEYKRGPRGETVGIDGVEDVRGGKLRRLWIAMSGVRLIVLAGVLAAAGVVAMAVIR